MKATTYHHMTRCTPRLRHALRERSFRWRGGEARFPPDFQERKKQPSETRLTTSRGITGVGRGDSSPRMRALATVSTDVARGGPRAADHFRMSPDKRLTTQPFNIDRGLLDLTGGRRKPRRQPPPSIPPGTYIALNGASSHLGDLERITLILSHLLSPATLLFASCMAALKGGLLVSDSSPVIQTIPEGRYKIDALRGSDTRLEFWNYLDEMLRADRAGVSPVIEHLEDLKFDNLSPRVWRSLLTILHDHTKRYRSGISIDFFRAAFSTLNSLYSMDNVHLWSRFDRHLTDDTQVLGQLLGHGRARSPRRDWFETIFTMAMKHPAPLDRDAIDLIYIRARREVGTVKADGDSRPLDPRQISSLLMLRRHMMRETTNQGAKEGQPNHSPATLDE